MILITFHIFFNINPYISLPAVGKLELHLNLAMAVLSSE